MTMKEYFEEMHQFLSFDEIRRNALEVLNVLERERLEECIKSDRETFHELTSKLQARANEGAEFEELTAIGEDIDTYGAIIKAERERLEYLKNHIS